MDSEPTEATQLVTGINRIISQNWKELVGGGQLTPKDIEFIKSVIKTPESIGTTAAEIRESLRELKRVLTKAQINRARTLKIEDYDPSVGPAPSLSGGGSADDLISEFE